MDSAEAGQAGTSVAVDIVSAVGSVLARVALTLIDVLLALCAPKAEQAGAQEAVHLILTDGSVAAGVCGRVGRRLGLSLCGETCPRDSLNILYIILI